MGPTQVDKEGKKKRDQKKKRQLRVNGNSTINITEASPAAGSFGRTGMVLLQDQGWRDLTTGKQKARGVPSAASATSGSSSEGVHVPGRREPQGDSQRV